MKDTTLFGFPVKIVDPKEAGFPELENSIVFAPLLERVSLIIERGDNLDDYVAVIRDVKND